MRQRLDVRLNVLPPPEGGLHLSRFFQKSWGIERGDAVDVEFLEGRPRAIAVPVAGFTDDLVGIAASVSLPSLWGLLEEEPSFNFAALKIDPAKASALYVKLKELPMIATVNFKASLYRGFQSSMGTMIRVTTGILIAFSLAIALGVVYNSIRVSFSERAWEMASLRVLGFSESETFRMLLAEIAVEVALSIVPGCLIGLGLTHFVLKGVNTETFGFPIVVNRASYATAISAVFAALVLSAAMVRRMIGKQNLAEALKARE
jgi:putative ABC transport system permease protein